MLLRGQKWYSHVGEHLYELAVFALQPSLWQTIPEDESSNNGSNKTIGSLSVGCEDSLSRPQSKTGAEPGSDFSRGLGERGVVQKEQFMKDWFQEKSQQEQYPPQKMPNYEGADVEADSGAAEVVGLAATIAGLASVASKASKFCYDHYSEVINYQEDIEQLASEISSLASLLGPLSTPAEASKISQTGSDLISQLVHECAEMLEQLQGELHCQLNKQSDSKYRNLGSLKFRLKWPFKKEDTQERIHTIERLKAAVTLELQLWVAHIFCS